MDGRHTGLVRACVFVALFAPVSSRAESLPAGSIWPLAVRDGRCECVVPTPRRDSKYLLIVGSLANEVRPRPIQIRTAATELPSRVDVADIEPEPSWSRRVGDLHDRLAKARQDRLQLTAYAPAPAPPKVRIFHLFVKERNFENPANYVAVTGELATVGEHCQAYVDRDCVDRSGLQPTIADAVQTFDQVVYPRQGPVLDVDRDGRFTILFTSWLGKLCEGKVALGGFVRGSDFYRDGQAPYSNRCDMMYLNTDLKPGPFLRSLLAHEYTHAVVFCEHVFGAYIPELCGHDEESWLNEALAHVTEDRHGFGWENLDYRIAAYLNAPERYSLVVPDYYTTGIWRDPGTRGATYLFLRWCVDQYGEGLTTQLTESSLAGVANLEAATCEPFAELFRRWTIALARCGGRVDDKLLCPFRQIALHQPLAGRFLCGPRLDSLPLTGGHEDRPVVGTSAAYFLLHSPHSARSRIIVDADPEAELQVTLIRLPDATARLAVQAEAVSAPNSIRLQLSVFDADVSLTGVAWERLLPVTNQPADTSYRPNQSPKAAVRDWFDLEHLKAGEVCRSRVISLPAEAHAGGPWVVKIAGVDALGHAVAAMTIVSDTTHEH